MNKRFGLYSEEFPGIELRTIADVDLENLRIWKNDHRESFFFKGIISPADQVKWFQGYLERPHDYMFVVIFDGHSIGCLGFRYIDERVDIYNVILGVPEMGQKGLIGKALRMLCSYAQKEYPGCQGAKVLRSNPAINWYQRNGFKVMRVNEEHVDIELDEESFRSCLLTVVPVTDYRVYKLKKENMSKMISVFGSRVAQEELEEIRSSLEAQWMGIGPKVKKFEIEFAQRLNLIDFAMLDSGSNSLYMAVKLLNLPPSSQIILPSFTWISCAHAIVLCGYTPVFCDVDLRTYNVTAETIAPHLTDKTAAIMVVHYAGKPVRMGSILELGLPIIEDAAHAVDSKLGDKYCGNIGTVGIYSFDAVKNLATPDGGGLTAQDAELVVRARLLRYCGIGKSGFEASANKDRWWEYNIAEFFPRFLPNDIVASVALAQLRKLDQNQARRRYIWELYQREFAELGWLVCPLDAAPDEQHSYFTYCVRVLGSKRDAFAKYMYENGIYTTLRYHPLHMNPIYKSNANLPVCEQLNEEALSLPMHPNLSDSDVSKIVDTVKRYGG